VTLLVDGKVEGLTVGSKEVFFRPGRIKSGKFKFDIGTAGSVTLVLQALTPVAAYAPAEVFVEIKGGTNNQWAPPVDYFEAVFLPVLKLMGFEGSISLLRRGFYPKGGGIVRARFNPVTCLKPLDIDKLGNVLRLWGLSYSCRLPSHIPERMVKTAKKILADKGYKDVDIKVESLQKDDPRCSLDPGCGILLVAEFEGGLRIGADSLGEIGKPAEKVAEEATLSLIQQLEAKASVDFHLADQLIVWVSLAEGTSKFYTSRLTLHTLTSIEICKQILGSKFNVEGEVDKPARITCEGIGWKNRLL
ncbi:MAG: RNA 3'-terminal phosphate cyclase, partial [Candidatus Bathyarchaeota archaeon]|nr:RNA 3'-terminal phosphate cyclase [Candidatus Bathyarchaeota archaeon]